MQLMNTEDWNSDGKEVDQVKGYTQKSEKSSEKEEYTLL